MRTEIALFQTRAHVSSPSLSAVALLGFLFCSQTMACKSSGGGGISAAPDGGRVGPASCSTNVGNGPANATTIASGQPVENVICYQGTSDWYRITVPAGDDLLDVAAGYPAGVVSPVNLDVKVFAESSSASGTLVQDLTTPPPSDAGVSSTIGTTLRVPGAGDYYIQVADSHGTYFDTNNAYTLSVTSTTDPDTHEPNDSRAAAKPTDSAPGWLAYLGDLDVFTTSAQSASDLLTLNLTNPASAAAPIQYQIASSDGTLLAEGSVKPSTTPLTTVFPISNAGAYYLTLSYAAGVTPDRSPSDGYGVNFGTTSNPDTNTNHTLANAVCPGGGTAPCTMAYSGTAVTLPDQTGTIAIPGQRDYYRVDVTSGAPLVLEIGVKSQSSSTPVQYAVDLLAPDPNSPCTTDSDCEALNQPCSADIGCEESHSCLPAGQYKFCPQSGVACQLCAGASLCVMNGSSHVCALSQFLSDYSPGQKPTGSSTASTAQPLFAAGPYYIAVHDAQNANYDDTNEYTLTLKMVPEPDPYDQATSAAGRNNFYNPYPTANTDRSPNKARAVSLTAAQLSAGVTGYISYQTDEDWFTFPSPCLADAGDTTCGINFEWTQPASNMKVAFFVLDPSSLIQRESFTYTGTMPPSAPVTSDFDNTDCSSCSFGVSGQTYYMQIADIHEKAWDNSSTGKYSFKVTGVTVGCPSVCTNSGGTCLSQCAASNTCCPTLQ